MTPIDIYINFVLYAIHGQMGSADTLMRRFGEQIRFVADGLAIECPIASKPIYRGVLLDPSVGKLGEHFPFVSWSEDRDCAAWFADRNSYISEPFREHHPEARGYTMALPAPKGRVLFHHSWRPVFNIPLELLALRHPHMGPDAYRQIGWSLDIQQEVIIEPLDDLALASFKCSAEETARLDRKFKPAWIQAEEGTHP